MVLFFGGFFAEFPIGCFLVHIVSKMYQKSHQKLTEFRKKCLGVETILRYTVSKTLFHLTASLRFITEKNQNKDC